MVVEHRLALGLLSLCLGVTLVYAQNVQNGQIYTNGLAIVNAPAIGTTLRANSNLQLSIDVSGNGKLEEAAWSPGSGRPTSYDSLNVFLTSAEQKVNFTVSTGSGLLTQEPGSTVKHFNWPIPNCISPGQYEVTLYENSHINGTPYFSITPLRLRVENANPSGRPCTSGLNDYQQDDQASSPSPTNPWIANTSSGPPTLSGFVPDGPTAQPTLPPPPQPASSGTSTGTKPLESFTVIVVSIQGVQFTATINGQPTVQTSYSTDYRTTTTVFPDGVGNSGFLPINRGESKHTIPKVLFTIVLCALFALAWLSL